MTVRQLEALVRLSEAIARSHLETQVLPRHVKVAVRLLKTSIISVESTEIDLSEFEAEYNDNNDENATPSAEGQAPTEPASGSQAGNGEGSADKQAKKLLIPDEEFQRITQALVMRLRQHEESVVREGSNLAGMQQKDLIKWYIEQQQAQKSAYSSVEEISKEVKKIGAIIESLIRREGYLIVVDDGRQAEDGDGERAPPSRKDRFLSVAPNFVVE